MDYFQTNWTYTIRKVTVQRPEIWISLCYIKQMEDMRQQPPDKIIMIVHNQIVIKIHTRVVEHPIDVPMESFINASVEKSLTSMTLLEKSGSHMGVKTIYQKHFTDSILEGKILHMMEMWKGVSIIVSKVFYKNKHSNIK